MGLENVKVGDKVWLCTRNFHRNIDKRLNLDTVSRITAKKFTVARHPKDLYDKQTGREYKGSDYYYTSIATTQEITRWENEQAQKKADSEAAEQARQQAYRERAERLIGIMRYIRPLFENVNSTGSVVTFEAADHKYRIEEEQ